MKCTKIVTIDVRITFEHYIWKFIKKTLGWNTRHFGVYGYIKYGPFNQFSTTKWVQFVDITGKKCASFTFHYLTKEQNLNISENILVRMDIAALSIFKINMWSLSIKLTFEDGVSVIFSQRENVSYLGQDR